MTQVIIEEGLIKKWPSLINGPYIVITDANVAHLYELPKPHLIIEAGEKSKTRQMKEHLENQMLEMGLGRDCTVVAIGGGVVSDLAGFVAATYCRGVNLITIPTTLLAMIDASIGGKVGVNTEHGKNLIGTFYQPKMVLVDPNVLATLPEKEILNGTAEIIKYGLTLDSTLLDMNLGKELIEKCISLKQSIVEQDPFEKGLRRVLNFGHTIGHAIEAASSYEIGHGEAIAIGMVVEGSFTLRESLRPLFEKKGFSLKLPATFDEKKYEKALNLDKKSLNQKIRFVLLEKIGKVLPFNGNYCTGDIYENKTIEVTGGAQAATLQIPYDASSLICKFS